MLLEKRQCSVCGMIHSLEKKTEPLKQKLGENYWQDPDKRKSAAAKLRESALRQWEDLAFRELVVIASSETSKQRWEDSEYRAKMSESHRALWQDPEYRQNQGAALREARLDPANRDRMVLPTIHGFRSDIGFYAQSAWEANIARVFQLIGREYIVGANLRLTVIEDFQELFQDSETIFNVDFSTIDGRGRTIMYELMAHPLEAPLDWAKLEMARRHHPELVVRVIDENFYNRLRRRFEAAINNSQLHGWEKTGFNLRTHSGTFA